MRLIQPKPNHDSPFEVLRGQRVACSAPVTFIKFRYRHHAGPSGYSRICDYIDAPTVSLSNAVYWLGETALRPFCIGASKLSGKHEYSRYDCTMEIQFLLNAMLRERNRIYHFIYGEKSFHLSERFRDRLKARGHLLVGTVHHMPEQQSRLFRSHDHFQCYDQLITMDEASIDYWKNITGKNNVSWIPNGVDCDFFHVSESKPDGPVRILFAGAHERDFKTLEATIRLLADESVHFELVGNSEDVAGIAEQYRHCVRVHRRLSDDEYRNLIRSCSLLLLPLNSSTFCNVVVESLACGLPVVTTQGGIEVYLNTGCSVVTARKDPEALASGVRTLLERLPVTSKAARAQALTFSWKSIAGRHVDFYDALATS